MTLNWNAARHFTSGNHTFFEVPFVSESGYSPVGSITTMGESTAPDYRLVFQQSTSGEVIARIKLTFAGNAQATANTQSKPYTNCVMFDDLEGNRKTAWAFTANIQRPIRIYKKQNSGTIVQSTTSHVSSVGLQDDCDYMTVPDYEYQCNGTSNTGDYNVTCGYVPIGYTVYSFCPPPDPGQAGGDDDFDYDGDNGGSNTNKDIKNDLDSFPCAQGILAELPNCNAEVAKLLDSVFGVSSSTNLFYTTDPNLGMTSRVNGYSHGIVGPMSALEDTIFMNPWVLKNSTQEFIAGTLLHEALHSVMDYWRKQVRMKAIDSAQFATMFPIFSQYGPPLTGTALAQHMEMANNYITFFVNYLRNFDPSIDPDIANAIAWTGLQKTDSWIAKGNDTIDIINKIHIARRDTSDSTNYSSYNLHKCP